VTRCNRRLRDRSAQRPASAARDWIWAGNQPQSRKGARPHRAADPTRARRRGDRV